jgi:hypothetical protein
MLHPTTGFASSCHRIRGLGPMGAHRGPDNDVEVETRLGDTRLWVFRIALEGDEFSGRAGSDLSRNPSRE